VGGCVYPLSIFLASRFGFALSLGVGRRTPNLGLKSPSRLKFFCFNPESQMSIISIRRLSDGVFIDASTGQDISHLIAAFRAFDQRSRAGKVGGAVKSARKTEACRANGKRGGRPRKQVLK
jgi:hypothetical protein